MKYFAWFFLLVVQNASFTWVSRARNSGSYGYHAIAAVFSNGIFFASQFILVENFISIVRTADWKFALEIGLLYITGTVIGSVAMHYISMEYLERGKRTIGTRVADKADSYKSGPLLQK